MALPKGPITIQVSPSTYRLMVRMTELGVGYDPATNDLLFDPTNKNIQNALDALYNVLGGNNATILAELKKLQTDGFTEASVINEAARSEIVLPC